MSQIIYSYDFLLALKAGEVKVLYEQSINAPEPLSRAPQYEHAYKAIKRLNYNQKGKFNLELRTSRDGTKLAAICTFDGTDKAAIPDEYKRKYRARKKAATPPKTPDHIKPLSFYMQAHHEGKKVEVLVGSKWRPVEPADWTTVKNENFRTVPRKVYLGWNTSIDAGNFLYDPDEEALAEFRGTYDHLKVFVEE